MAPEWKDISSRKRNQVDKTPTAWELRPSDTLCIVVHRHIDHPGEWVVSGYDLSIHARPLGDIAEETAKSKGIAVIRKHLEDHLSSLDNL